MSIAKKIASCLILIQIIWLNPIWAESSTEIDLTENTVKISEQGLTFIEPNKIIFNIEVKDGFFAYLEKFKLEIEGLKVVSLEFDPVITFYDQTFQKNKQGLKSLASGTALFEINTLETRFKSAQQLQAKLNYQACTEEYCLFPASFDFIHRLNDSQAEILNQLKTPKWMNQGFIYALAFVFFAGLLTSLTPCVYPLIPITIAVLGRQKSDTKLKGFIKSSIYVLGMALTYSILGLFAATSGFMFGSLLSNIYFLSFLSLVFFAAALSMYDVFEIKSPQFLNKFNKQQKKSYVGIFISGAFSGLVVGPCVGPVLIGVLTYISMSRNILSGFSLMFAFALGLGSLIIVLATFSNLMQKVPKSGQWMNSVKKALSLVFLLMIGYFLKPILGLQSLFIILSLFFSAFSLLVIFKISKEGPTFELSFFKSIFISALMVILFSSIMGKERFDRFVGYNASTFANTHWEPFTDVNLNEAKQNQQIVILDFYADWCAACKELKHKTFSDPKVLDFKDKIKWLYFDSTKPSQKLDEYKKRFGILGLPTILFFNSKGEIRSDLTLTGYEDPKLFIERMQKIED